MKQEYTVAIMVGIIGFLLIVGFGFALSLITNSFKFMCV